MNHGSALSLVNWIRSQARKDLGLTPSIGFVSPIVSTVLAAGCMKEPTFSETQFSTVCRGYAEVSGLVEALSGVDCPIGQTANRHGRTYSKLTRLKSHDDVNACNAVIADVLYEHLGGPDGASLTPAIVKVIGELHDNVASHARGYGFSAAQVYSQGSGQRLEFAVTDAGCGMLDNVCRVDQTVTTHVDAIEWCLVPGHTTAKPLDDWAQRLPDDYAVNPYPKGTKTYSTDDHHAGLGLNRLTELVRAMGGRVWIWTGNAQFLMRSDGTVDRRTTGPDWSGLAIELELCIQRAQSLAPTGRSSDASDDVAGRFGL
jgi:hypothetical protein